MENNNRTDMLYSILHNLAADDKISITDLSQSERISLGQHIYIPFLNACKDFSNVNNQSRYNLILSTILDDANHIKSNALKSQYLRLHKNFVKEDSKNDLFQFP